MPRRSHVLVEFLLRAAGGLLLVDLLSGFFHWLEDSYGHAEWPVTGKYITQANILHHFDPGHFTRHSWLDSARVLFAVVACCLTVARILGFSGWMLWLMAAIGVNANQIHKWAHRSTSENGRLIRSLQRVGILQSPSHHARHHHRGKDSYYCVVTNYANPVLEWLHVWRGLEGLIFLATGVHRRPDPSLRRDATEARAPACRNRRCAAQQGRDPARLASSAAPRPGWPREQPGPTSGRTP